MGTNVDDTWSAYCPSKLVLFLVMDPKLPVVASSMFSTLEETLKSVNLDTTYLESNFLDAMLAFLKFGDRCKEMRGR